ncbi:component of the polarisome [Maudiozyma exigua]|uniref:Component of the polarisome n=1 Tax=Maudiozyma exigua TaxID=34358 RepID=A0A9P6VZ75_MAUEX|nr:component of the polarisome [Kazachstania exigua]
MPSHDTKYKEEIGQYYFKLKNFKQITGDVLQANDKKTKRAAKARSKLSSLSTRQFYELNVDVNDELSRRINEEDTNSITLKLMDKDSTEKRNNARKKLAALTDARFDELVNDLISEIELRGMNDPNQLQNNEQKTNDGTLVSSFNASDMESEPQSENGGLETQATIEDSEAEDLNEKPIAKPIETKVNVLAKSSSVETDTYTDILRVENKQSAIFETLDDHDNETELKEAPAITDGVNETEEPDAFLQSSHIIPVKASIDWSDDDDSDESPTKFDQGSIVDMEPTTGIEITKIDKNYISQPTEVSSYSDLLEENKRLKQELSLSNLKQTDAVTITYANSSKIDLKIMEKYVDNDLGSVPMHLAEKFHATINHFYKCINDTDNMRKPGENEDNSPDTTLFKIIFQISKVVSQIVELVDIPIFKQEVILLKAAVSQGITSVRYFSIYGDLLPNITIHAAIADISFAFCNLIKVTKLKIDPTLYPHSVLSDVHGTPVSNEKLTIGKPLKLARNLQNHQVNSVEASSKIKTPKRNLSRQRSKRSPFRRSSESDKFKNIPLRNASRTEIKNNIIVESDQDEFDFNQTPTTMQGEHSESSVSQANNTNKSIKKNGSNRSSIISDGQDSRGSSISRKTSRSSKSKWRKNKNRNSKHKDMNQITEKPVANSPDLTKTSKKSAKKFADKIKTFGNNNSLGLRMMPHGKTSKVK